MERLDRKKGDQQDTWMSALWRPRAHLVSMQWSERRCLVIRVLRYIQKVERRFWVGIGSTEESLWREEEGKGWPQTCLSGNGLAEQSLWGRASLLSVRENQQKAKTHSYSCFFYFICSCLQYWKWVHSLELITEKVKKQTSKYFWCVWCECFFLQFFIWG